MRLWIPLLTATAALATPAGAQTTNPDDWQSPFPAKQAAPPPKPAEPAKPVEPAPPKKEEAPPPPQTAVAPAPAAPATVAAAAAAAAADEADEAAEEATVISTQERFLPGSEPHSPGTWGRALSDPRNLRHASSAPGAVGLLRLGSADLGTPGLLRFSATGEYFTSQNFPVRTAQDVRSAGTFALSYVPLDFLEAYLAYGVIANTNSFSSPRLIQTLGDLTFGIKASRRWAQGLFAGLDARLLSYSAVGNQDVRRFAFGFAPHALATYDFREAWPTVPIRLHGNVGVILDGSGSLVQHHTLTASEEFALGIHTYHRFSAGVGLEVPLPAATPFVEWGVQVPLGVEDGELPSPDGTTIPVTQAMPHRLGFGVRLTAMRDLTITAAADLGLASGVGLGVPATPPYNLYLAAAFTLDPVARADTKLVETVRERRRAVEPLAKTGKIEGMVVDALTKKPVPGVIVAMVGAQLPPVASAADSGRFLTHELPAGPVRLEARKDGYREAAIDLVLEPGRTKVVELALDPLARVARFLFSVTGARKKPVAATVQLRGPSEHQLSLQDGAKEPAKQEAPAGQYTVSVTATGYLAQTREVQVSEDAEMAVAFELQPEPKKRLVIVKESKLEILQQVHFATGKATIMAKSFPLLAQVIDAIVTNDLKRIRVEGHTDNKGNKVKNLKLSQDRAAAVADYLVKTGIDRSRLDTAGFGDTRPIAPNLTEPGRKLNRRVEFIILR